MNLITGQRGPEVERRVLQTLGGRVLQADHVYYVVYEDVPSALRALQGAVDAPAPTVLERDKADGSGANMVAGGLGPDQILVAVVCSRDAEPGGTFVEIMHKVFTLPRQ